VFTSILPLSTFSSRNRIVSTLSVIVASSSGFGVRLLGRHGLVVVAAGEVLLDVLDGPEGQLRPHLERLRE
jgi:hypothetical protein